MKRSPLARRVERTKPFESSARHKLSLVATSHDQEREICVLQGRDAVLGRLPQLNALCERTGQTDAGRWLDFQMRTLTERKKIPTLVLVGTGAQTAAAGDLRGAVILYEYKIAGFGTKVFAGDDSTGQRVVIAAKYFREQMAMVAFRGLMAQGARAVMLSYEGADLSACKARSEDKFTAATRARSVPLYLPLRATFEATLAGLGRHTRRNLRYYRRRAESQLGAKFVSRAVLTEEEFLAINRRSMNPVAGDMAQWRYEEFAGQRDALFAGVRTSAGNWLSLIGGRRHRGVTQIDWQMNLAGYPRLSLSTVTRSYLLEHEVSLGTQTLVFNGGTPHSMRHSFVPVDAVDVVALRKTTAARLLRALGPRVLPSNNFLAQALCDPEMSWSR